MKVLNFGSLNLDHVYRVDHHVRTGETLTSFGFETHVGGKGLNQSIALKRAGCEVYHAGLIGEDGGMLRDYLQTNGVDVSLLKVCEKPTGHAMIQINAQGDNCILLFPGTNRMITADAIAQTLRRFGKGDWLVLQNEVNGLEQMMRQAKEMGMRIAFNPSPVDDGLSQLPLDLVDVFLLNEVEGESLTGSACPDDILNRLREAYPHAQIVLTLGKKGSLYADGERTIRQPAFQVQALDTTAAGDTFTGFFLSGLMHGAKAQEALELAAMASALAVTKKGAAESIPTLDETRAMLEKSRS